MSDAEATRPKHGRPPTRYEGRTNVRAEVEARRSPLGRAAHGVGTVLAKPGFFAALAALHVGWIALNLDVVPYPPWDPYPFPLLAMIASVEAPFISLLILMRQRQDMRIEELREEVDLQVALHTSRQTTELLRVLIAVGARLEVPEEERTDRLARDIDPTTLIDIVRRRLDEVEGTDD